MQLKIWENPLVVSAMRLKYRRGSPGLTCSGYLLALLGIGALLHYYDASYAMPFGRAYLLAIMTLQLLISGGIALITVSGSINAELANRTLDFQRLVALSPREIIVGKMIGEPVICHFLLLTTIPLAVLCSALGGGSLLVIALLYVNLATFSLMAASIGAISPLTPPSQKTGRQQNSGVGWLVFLLLFWTFPTLARGGAPMLGNPWVGNLLGSFTPIASLMQLASGNAWHAEVQLWNVSVPALLAAPLINLAVAAWAVEHMARRFTNAIDPPVSKRMGYAGLLACDLAIAGTCYRLHTRGGSANGVITQFAIAHVLVALLLLLLVTPQRPALMSWVWRFRGRLPAWRDLLFGDRRDVSLTTLCFAVIGAVTMCGALAGPLYLSGPVGIGLGEVAAIMGAATLLIVSLGMLYQWMAAMAGRSGTIMYILLALAAVFMPLIAGAILEESPMGRNFIGLTRSFYGVTPVTFFVKQLGGATPTRSEFDQSSPWLFVGAYAAVGAASWWGIRAWLQRQRKIVDRKLRAMDVGPCR